MNTRVILRSALAAAAIVGLTAAPAFAAGSVSVKAGTSTSGTTTYTATTTGASPQVYFADSTSGIELSCTSATAAGSITLGTAVAAPQANIASSTWSGCVGPLGLAMKVTQNTRWDLSVTGNTAAGVTPGTIAAVDATVAATAGGCSFRVSGTVQASVNTSSAASQTLSVTDTGSTLKVSNVAGCFGQLTNGDDAVFVADYALTAASGALTINASGF